ncbi:MAG: AIR synthase-related protein [Kiritimatiellae bacterium]|nr:AIR synthase-related protein [Kiritimatiellia bacterium]MDW8459063.1 AIR synthase-related protein [Verrucomicrobiota bacterium]
MAIRIEIGLKPGVPDPRGEGTAWRARSYLQLPVRSCRTRDVYLIDVPLNPDETGRTLRAFCDPVTQEAALDRLPAPPFDWLLEIGFKPGVTDNVGRTARDVLADVLDRPIGPYEQVYTATQYFLIGPMERSGAERIAAELLANPLIHTVQIYSRDEWLNAPPHREPPVIRDDTAPAVREIDLEVPDDELLRISRDGILSLSLDEMRAIRDYYRRPDIRAERASAGLPPRPTDLELECLAQTWSEHCKHKIFAAKIRYRDENGAEREIDSLFKTFIRATTEQVSRRIDWLVSVFSDNAGVIRFNERWNILFKVETHNSPSALDPYGGAITGIVGVNRDALGTGVGGEMVCNTWGYCFGPPDYAGDLPEGLMHPRRIRDGVHQGVIDGGNQSGIPWARGWERFDERFLGKPLVFCGTVGRLPVLVGGRPSERKEVLPGDYIVMAGGRIGKDGIHGATFSSEELRQESPSQAVQIGDPITQRKLYEFLIEARDLGLYRTLTDNGAGGLSSSIGEMCRLSGGADVDLTNAPLKYEGLHPWEIFLSEAQERMTLAVPPECWDSFAELARRRDVEVARLGVFTQSGLLRVSHRGRLCGMLRLDFLHDGCPRMELAAAWSPPRVPPPKPLRAGNRSVWVLRLLAAPNIRSKEPISRHYDGEVKGLSVLKPFVGICSDVPSDATILRVDYESREGIVLAEGVNPFLSDLDTYAMAASAVDEAVRRIVSAGGRWDRIAALDNFCWPDPVLSEKTPDGPYKLAQLVRANQALYDVCTAYGVPLISGKDSMKNDSTRGGRKISIPPTLLISTIGKIDDVRQAVTMPFKQAGDAIFVIGLTRSELGASEYHRQRALAAGQPHRIGGQPPSLDLEMAKSIYHAMNEAQVRGLIRSSHTPTLGGLAIAFAFAALGGGLGARIALEKVPEDGASLDALLFAESNSRFVVTCPAERAAELEAIFRGLPCARVGDVMAAPELSIGLFGRKVVDLPLDKIRRAYQTPF